MYLLLGPENGEKDEFIRQLRLTIAKQSGEPPEEHRYYPFDADYTEIVAILRNNALFSNHRFVLLNQADEIKKKADIDALISYCSAPVEDATLVLVSDEFTSRINKRLRDAVSSKNTKIFYELFENKKRSLIIDYFSKAGVKIEIEAVNLLLELVENDTRDLKRECERLLLLTSESQTITADHVDELVYHSKEENVFTLFDHMAGGDFPGSLDALQNLRLSGKAEPSQILGGLVYQFRRLLSVKGYVSRRLSYEEALKKANIRGKKNGRTYTDACRRYSTEDIENILALISDYEEEFRSGLTDLQDIGLQLFLYDTVVKKGSSGTPFKKTDNE